MKGFSLLEIMVTVAIISIMASSVVIGFNSFGETIRVKETAGVITDMVKNMELEMIRRDYKKQTIHFEEDYLVVEAEVENQYLTLNWIGVNKDECGADEGKIVADNAADMVNTVYLAQRDKYGNNVEIKAIGPGDTMPLCVDFKNSEETEWQYQVFRGSQASQVIRFLHFNIRRGDSEDPPKIEANNKLTLEISAPYASKEFFDNDGSVSAPVTLTVKKDDNKETITLQ